MASLHRHSSGRSPFWFAKFRGPDGRIVVKSTKQKKKAAAMVVATQWERAAQMGREGTATEAQYRKVLSDMLEMTTGETLRNPSTEAFFNKDSVVSIFSLSILNCLTNLMKMGSP